MLWITENLQPLLLALTIIALGAALGWVFRRKIRKRAEIAPPQGPAGVASDEKRPPIGSTSQDQGPINVNSDLIRQAEETATVMQKAIGQAGLGPELDMVQQELKSGNPGEAGAAMGEIAGKLELLGHAGVIEAATAAKFRLEGAKTITQDPEKSLFFLQTATNWEPESPHGWFLMGKLLQSQNDLDGALEASRKLRNIAEHSGNK